MLITGVRTGELRAATREQFNLEQSLWIVPPELVKQLQDRLKKAGREIPSYVPLLQQALAIDRFSLDAMKPAQCLLLAHRSDLTKGISENTLNGALKRMGHQNQLTGHGIRATIDTALHELGYNHNWIESQHSHANSDPYNHAKYVEQRRQMMQDWADRIDIWELEGLQSGGRVIAATQVPATFQNDTPITWSKANAADCGPAEGSSDHSAPRVVSPVMTIVARADQRPQPVLTDMQRERAAMLAIFESPHNLPLQVFAKLAGKSRDQINRDIKSKRLLSLSFGNRGHRIPEWQLDCVKHRLIQEVLKRATDADAWNLYRILSQPLQNLACFTPLEMVMTENLNQAVVAVCEALEAEKLSNVRWARMG